MRVLLVDYSVGFGGATKSIGLVLRQLPEVEFHVYTCQDSVQCKLWYNTLPVVRFRQRVNYVTLGQTRRVAERRLLLRADRTRLHATRMVGPFGNSKHR